MVGHGKSLVPLGEFFVATRRDDELLVFEGDLSRCDRIGWQIDGGVVVVDGPAGHYLGALMIGGEIIVRGNAGDLVGCEMAGGRIQVDGSIGDFAAGTQPGSMDGMRGGTLVVRGNAGARLADRMRRGTVVVHGDCGDFLASRLVAGTIAIGGRCGAHVAYGMRRGSVVFAGSPPMIDAATFVPAISEPIVFWQLLARDLERHGGVFEHLARRRINRQLGDRAVEGKGELIVPR